MDNKLTHIENCIMRDLTAAWNKFILLEPTHPDDILDFKKSLHDMQRVLATRLARRVNPEIFRTVI